MKPIELNYIEKNGLLYPDIQISNIDSADERPIGKYGMMWLNFIKEFHYERYVELKMSGELMTSVHQVNDEAYEIIDNMLRKSINTISRLIAEETVIKEFVLIVR